MIEITINKNDANQRFDRFLRKYFSNAPLSLLQKNIRKKNFKINGKRATADMFVKEADVVNMYISDSDYNKWVRKIDYKASDFDLDIVYEDKNIIILDKKSGLLTHSSNPKEYGNNLVDQMISYLLKTKKVDSRDKTFTPAVVNRLDRNTEGLVIGAKNAMALRNLNKAIRENKISKYYLTIVKGDIKEEFTVDTYISKNENKNKVKQSDKGSRIITKFRPIESNGSFSLIECELLTGKTHQIRYSLKKNKTPIIGDIKYGNKDINNMLFDKLAIKNQVLLAYKLKFGEIEGLEYLKDREFFSKKKDNIISLKSKVFKL
mgnify:CR=1 FL=1